MSRADTSHPPNPGEGLGRERLLRRLLRAGWRTLDGALLLALGWLARCWPRGKGGRGVVLVTNTMAVGGAQRQILLWLKHSAATYAPVRLVLLEGHGCWEDEAPKLGVSLEIIGAQVTATGLGRWLMEAMPRCAYVLGLWRCLRRVRPQVVWSWLFLSRVVAAPAARLAAVPRVVTAVRNLAAWKTWPENRHWWYRAADRNAAALADQVMVNAAALVPDYARWARCDPGLIRVVVNGVEDLWPGATPPRVVSLRPSGKVPLVLAVGRLALEKRQQILLHVSARLYQRGVRHTLVLVGGGPLAGQLERQAKELGLEGVVVFAGECADAREWLLRADVFVLSSAIEGMPNALMEAQLCGLPAVTTDAGGAGEVVVDGETGFVVPVGDEASFAAALQRLLEDPELRRRMGEAGRRRMLEEFSVERMVREIDQLFAELGVVGGKASGG